METGSSTQAPSGNVRIANSQDVQTITALINAAFRVAENFFVDADRVDEDEVTRLLHTGTFLLLDDPATVGCVYIEPRGDRTYLGLLSVDPECQRRGVGSRLLAAAEEHSRRLGSRFMDILIVNLRVELPAYYQKRGYVETGTSPFPDGVHTKVPCSFINMSKAL